MAQGRDGLFDRNWGFFSSEEQARLAQARVLLAGCGLGSNIAVLAARTGFVHFTLADGDAVERSNLNRQAFRTEHIGRNKAEATADLLREVNPDARIRAIPRFLQPEDAAALMDQCDIAVNMVDPGPTLHALLNAARERGVTTLFPLNIAFGGLLMAFGPRSPSLADLIGQGPEDELFVRIVERLVPALPSYVLRFAPVLERVRRERLSPPQLGIAAAITASLVVDGLVRAALGHPLPLAPTIVTLDAREPRQCAWPSVPVEP